MKTLFKNNILFFLIIVLFFTSFRESFAANSNLPVPLEPNNGHLSYIANKSQIISNLSVEYQICSYDYTNSRIKAWKCNKPHNDVAVIPQDSLFSIFVPNNQVDQNGNVQVEYAVEVFAVTNTANNEELRKAYSSICRTSKDKNTLVLTDNPRNNSGDKIICAGVAN